MEVDGLDGIPGLLERAGSRRVLLITGESQRYVARVRDLIGASQTAAAEREVEISSGARRHVPEAIVRAAVDRLNAVRADTVVALGGGSAIGLGKALRLVHDAPLRFIAVPTTY